MTEPNTTDSVENDLFHYLGILEAVVAVLAIKSGLNPETMMAKAIEEITEQTGMETTNTERIIRERWQGRDLSAGVLVARALPATLSPQPVATVEQTIEPPTVDMRERFREWKAKQPTP